MDEVVALVRQRKADAPVEEQVLELERILRRRFYHGYTSYGIHENWIAWLSAQLINPHFNALVEPEEIMKHDAAACSQQGIVVQSALTKLGVKYATVELPFHFQAAAWLNGKWYIVDPWGPMDRDRSRLYSVQEWVSTAERDRFLLTDREKERMRVLDYEIPRLVKIEQFPAKNARLFHKVTGMASDWLWLVLLAMALAVKPRGWALSGMWPGKFTEPAQAGA